jgi:hypothetical protein
MPDDRIHSGEGFPIDRFSRQVKNAADATHGCFPKKIRGRITGNEY